ncbi:hypothetical protein AMECASPLE_002782 [Ameca splendens]|uniref:Uncharacterized protein n=1 Tax=Ameca splendens TaxID=208324 RepID=A0ABV0ZVA6_9TELE
MTDRQPVQGVSQPLTSEDGSSSIITLNKFKSCMVVQLVALLSCSKKVLGSDPTLQSFCMEFACSACACVGSLQVLQLPPTVQKHVRLIGLSKLTLGMSVCMHGCLSFVSLCYPMMVGRPVQGGLRFLPNNRWKLA